MNPNLPSGTVTFLFTDIEGSTRLWEKHPAAMKTALAKHDIILKKAIQSTNGHIIKGRGDGIHAVFATAIDAVNATISVQREFERMNAESGESNGGSTTTNSPSPITLRIRIGLHTGEAEVRDGDYYGQAPNLAARIMSAGHGGQILLSEVTAQVAREHLPADTTLLDLGEHELKGLRRPERIYQLASSGLQKEFPELNSISTATNNLPTQLTSFIGRERELAEAQEKLGNARLLTLIGPGGIGKTRLSLKIASFQLANFDDGVWLVELAPITDPVFIVTTIALVFGVREVPGIPLINLVIDYLRDKELLLILDNCEHLVEVCAQIADQLLHACVELKIIASSREALGIGGEAVYRVPPLSAPQEIEGLDLDGASGVDLESLLNHEATRLFVERAAKAEPRFNATRDNASSIIQICRRLDGIPLAIELAAARVKLFTPEQIAEKLDNRFKLLTGGSRTALPRQQTLQALIDWSYQFLDEIEQRSFRQLAVFSGGWTFDAAESVVGEVEALDGLLGLVSKSLVNVEEQDNRSRYYFLETIRQYAMAKLVDSGEAVETRNRHLDYVLNLMERSHQSIFDNVDPESMDNTEAELDNLRAALEWATANHPGKALILSNAVGGFWTLRDYNSEARNWCKTILKKTASMPNVDADLARLYALLGWVSIQIGEHKDGRAAAEKALELAQNSKNTMAIAHAYSVLALACIFLGDYSAGQEAIIEGEKVARESGRKAELAIILSARGQMEYYAEKNIMQAKHYLDESAQLAREEGFLWGSSIVAFGRAIVAVALGDHETVRARFMESAEVALRTGNKSFMYSSKSEYAHYLREHGKLDDALAIYLELLPKWQQLGHRSAVAHELECIAFILIKKDKLVPAAILLGAAQALREVIDSVMTRVEQAEYEKEIPALRARMEPDEFQESWSKGRMMTVEQSITLALEFDPTKQV